MGISWGPAPHELGWLRRLSRYFNPRAQGRHHKLRGEDFWNDDEYNLDH